MLLRSHEQHQEIDIFITTFIDITLTMQFLFGETLVTASPFSVKLAIDGNPCLMPDCFGGCRGHQFHNVEIIDNVVLFRTCESAYRALVPGPCQWIHSINLDALASIGNYFVGIAKDDVVISRDGLSWTKVDLPTHFLWKNRSLKRVGEALVLDATYSSYTFDGVNWQEFRDMHFLSPLMAVKSDSIIEHTTKAVSWRHIPLVVNPDCHVIHVPRGLDENRNVISWDALPFPVGDFQGIAAADDIIVLLFGDRLDVIETPPDVEIPNFMAVRSMPLTPARRWVYIAKGPETTLSRIVLETKDDFSLPFRVRDAPPTKRRKIG